MTTCAYCNKRATTTDAIGLDVCQAHAGEADAYHKRVTGHDPNDDTFKYCPEHSDMWQPNCERCETCCQHHYGMTVQQFLDSPTSRQLQVHSFDSAEEMMTFLSSTFR